MICLICCPLSVITGIGTSVMFGTSNTKNNAHIEWLTSGKAAWRFMTAAFNKRDFFKETN